PSIASPPEPRRPQGPPPPRPSRSSGSVPPPRPSGTPAPTLAKPPVRPAAKSTLPPPPRHAPVAQPASQPAPRASAPVPKPVPQPSRPTEAKRVDAVAPGRNPFAAMPTFASPPRPSLDITGDIVASESWFESSRAVEKFEDETFVGTAPVVKLERRRKLAVLKIVGTSVVFVVIGVVIGAYIAFHGDSARKPVARAAPATPAKTVVQPMPAPEAAAAQPAAPPTTPKLADVRIDSTPPGATVTLVDVNKTSLLGTTPLATSLDPSRAYDVIFTLEGRPAKQAHLELASSRHLEIALDKP